jgi:uncharacterized protein with PQ loop repeat
LFYKAQKLPPVPASEEHVKKFIASFIARFSKHPAGAIGGLLQLAVVFVGMPMQISLNYHSHSTAGLSGWMFISAGLASVAWFVHAKYEINSAPLFMSQIPSIFFSCVIVGQMVCY